jgi:hypothetical protein
MIRLESGVGEPFRFEGVLGRLDFIVSESPLPRWLASVVSEPEKQISRLFGFRVLAKSFVLRQARGLQTLFGGGELNICFLPQPRLQDNVAKKCALCAPGLEFALGDRRLPLQQTRTSAEIAAQQKLFGVKR